MHGLECVSAEQKTTTIEFLRECLGTSDEKLLFISIEGISKCYVWDRLEDDQLILALFTLYFHPATQQMQPVVQCLSYFFATFARTHAHQLLISQVFSRAFSTLIEIHDGSTVATLSKILEQYLMIKPGLSRSLIRAV
jgi:Nuclear condensing complex subunits, C-term domain